ncbi:hypothetical protein like AT3G19910 [Hibiscus trionum]|uniref:RING-type domain-containing protein n=1 Tax=Hibiscus trionum TaxID=183268 RepID=A0A9W7HT52_HIBTR|nr:hypothetical protein like AT3G19910 [Hibiscus trionum]
MESEASTKQSSERVPFAQLDQVESDFAMALALQEQERVFLMLETIGSNYDDDDNDQSNNNDSEYFGVGDDLEFLEGQYIDNVVEDMEYDNSEEDDDDEIDLDDFSYEELIALGEMIGIVKRGLSEDEISSCLVPFKFRSIERESRVDRCVICQVEYVDDEGLVALSNCEHPYHSDCISKWLQMKRNCPICSVQISSSNNVV